MADNRAADPNQVSKLGWAKLTSFKQLTDARNHGTKLLLHKDAHK
jgi:hypothetical protein